MKALRWVLALSLCSGFVSSVFADMNDVRKTRTYRLATKEQRAEFERRVDSLIKTLNDDITRRVKADGLQKSVAYFLVPFAYEGPQQSAGASHTFAAFVEVTRGDADWKNFISWLPENFADTESIDVFKDFGGATLSKLTGQRGQITVGKNQDLDSTLWWGFKPGQKIAVWGPYRITKEFFELGEKRSHSLRNEHFQYLADDTGSRFAKDPKENAFNCMHAVSDLPNHVDHSGFLNNALVYGLWGIKGTQNVLRHFDREFSDQLIGDNFDLEGYRSFDGLDAP